MLNVAHLKSKLDIERNNAQTNPGKDQPTLGEIDSFENAFIEANKLMQSFSNSPNSPFGVFDFTIDDGSVIISINRTIVKELEYDIFNAARMSFHLPFISINVDSNRIHKTSSYVAEDRKFKTYYPESSKTDIKPLIKKWSTDKKMNVARTMTLKVMGDPYWIPGQPVKDKMYIRFIYSFNKGLKASLIHGQTDANLNYALQVLNSEIKDFEFTSRGIDSISGHFVPDNVVLDRDSHSSFMLRHLLISAISIPGTDYKLQFGNFLWFKEAKQSLGMRTHVKLKLKLGDMKQKIGISTKDSLDNNFFYQNGVPHQFKSFTKYNEIFIEGSKTFEDAKLAQSIISTAVFLYAFPKNAKLIANAQGIPQEIYFSESQEASVIIESLVNGLKLTPSVLGESFKIDYDSIMRIKGKIAKLKAVDPTFYRRIGTAREISGKERQVEFLVRTTDPNWLNIMNQLYNHMLSINSEVQILRYPFVVSNPPSVEYETPMKTIIPPYFLMASPASPYFQLKPNKNPKGTDGTIHPFIISSAKNIDIITPGSTLYDKFRYLVDLTIPFTVTFLDEKSSRRNTSDITTYKALSEDNSGQITMQLESILNHYIEKNVQISNTHYLIMRYGVSKGVNSLIHACLANINTMYQNKNAKAMTGNVEVDAIVNEYHSKRSVDERDAFVQNVLKPDISKRISWLACKQELYDISVATAKEVFLGADTEIKYFYYKRVLELYFNACIIVISYDTKSFSVEIPRNKFYHIREDYPDDAKPMLFFKHSRPSPEIYEPIYLEDETIRNKIYWDKHALLDLFDTFNSTVSLSFDSVYSVSKREVTIAPSVNSVDTLPNINKLFKNIQRQYIDGAGKLRGFVCEGLMIWCEPMAPISVATFNLNNFQGFIKGYPYQTVLESLRKIFNGFDEHRFSYKTNEDILQIDDGGKLSEDLTEEVMVIGLWFEVSNIPFYISLEPTKISNIEGRINNESYFDTVARVLKFQQFDYYERLANILVQLVQILYLYSSYDDPIAFAAKYFYMNTDPNFKYDLSSFTRRLPIPTINMFEKNPETNSQVPGLPIFELILEMYKEHFKSVFVIFTPNDSTIKPYPQLIISSEKIRRGLIQHIKKVQTLKENLFGSAGHDFLKYAPGTDHPQRGRQILWNMNPFGNSYKLERGMIERIPKLKALMRIPSYFKEFYVYSTDFDVRGPDQVIFMSKEEMEDYQKLQNMEQGSKMIFDPSELNDPDQKNPIYYQTPDGMVYIIQNVLGSSTANALTVMDMWEKEKINMGYYVHSTDRDVIGMRKINQYTINDVPEDLEVSLFHYEGDSYAALLKFRGSVKYSFPENAPCKI